MSSRCAARAPLTAPAPARRIPVSGQHCCRCSHELACATDGKRCKPAPEAVAWIAIGDSCDRSGGFFCVPSVHVATCAVHTSESLQRTVTQLYTSETAQSDTSALAQAAHTSPSSTPDSTRVDSCGGCPDLRSSLCLSTMHICPPPPRGGDGS